MKLWRIYFKKEMTEGEYLITRWRQICDGEYGKTLTLELTPILGEIKKLEFKESLIFTCVIYRKPILEIINPLF